MSQHFAVMDTNPNVGGGCLCAEDGTQDSKGPFAVFNATEQESNVSPFPVLCAGCALRAAELIAKETQPPLPRQAKRARDKADALEDGPSI